jgi:hypothetical protein
MNKVMRIMATVFAFTSAWVTTALAGGSYGSEPTVADSGADVGVLLIVAVAALLVIRSLNKPASGEAADDAADKTE